ncbi:MAG: hypothetical protein HPY44_18870 [Armatimonadetes bacterium]|nr:hypothetical protein [Armatimonadota bacterium]
MIRDAYRYVLDSPMHAGTRKPYGRFMECADYVPGSVVRGACAEVILKHCPNRRPGDDNPECPRETANCPAWDGEQGRCLFTEMFEGDSALLFSNAYAMPCRDDALPNSRPAPLTLRQCSLHPGSVGEYERRLAHADAEDSVHMEDPPHGLWDTLISGYALECRERLALDEGKIPQSPSTPEQATQDDVDHGSKCPRCLSKAEPVRGYVLQVREGSRTYWMSCTPGVQRRVHVALNRSRRSAEEGLLFSRESVHCGSKFCGDVIGPEGREDLLRAVSRAFGPGSESVVVFGRGGSAGLGRTRTICMGREHDDSLRSRLCDLDKAVQDVAPRPGYVYFSIDAWSALVACPGVPPDWARTLGLSGVETVFVRQAVTTVSGWSNMPRQGEFGQREARSAVAAGSVYLCAFQGKIDELADALENLEDGGVGDWREMGYGRVEFSSPIHLMCATRGT